MKTRLVRYIYFVLTPLLLIQCTKEEIEEVNESQPRAPQNTLFLCTELSHTGHARAFGSTHSFWDKNVLRVRFMGGSSYVQAKVAEHAREWSKYAGIAFEFVDQEPSDIRISFDQSTGSWSYVGNNNRYISPYRATMNFGWFNDNTRDAEFRRTTLHEFGHAIGLSHEHQHPSASIQWNREAVYAYYQRTQDWSIRDVDANIFRKYAASNSNYSQYDPTSIMHYYIPSSLVLGHWNAPWNTTLSSTDKQFIASIYPREEGESPSESTQCSCGDAEVILACEDFENHTQQTFLASQIWMPWSSDADKGELQTYDWGKVLKIQYHTSSNPDVLYAPEISTQGAFRLSWYQYVGTQNTAYFNIQKAPKIGEEFGAQFYFDTDATGSIQINNQQIEFDYQQNQWLKIELLLDTDNDRINYFIDEVLKGSFPYSWSATTPSGSRQFSMLNFYAVDEDARFWLDDFCLSATRATADLALSKVAPRGSAVVNNHK